jgi:hypothetical protein
VNAVNAVIHALIAWALAPLAGLPPWFALVVFGAISGVVAAIVFRFTSSQAALKRVGDQTRAALLAMRLFSDDPRNTLRAQFALLAASGRRLLLSLPPMLVMIVPFAILLTHLAMWYEFAPLRPGATPLHETALLQATFSEAAWKAGRDLTPGLPDGVALTGRVRDDRTRTVTWRLNPQLAIAAAKVTFSLPNGSQVEKSIVTGDGRSLALAVPRRPGPAFLDRVLYPAEPAFAADSPVQSIAIQYPRRSTPILGVNVPWWLTFFIASIVGALLAKPFVGVRF